MQSDGTVSLTTDPEWCSNTTYLKSTTILQTGQWYFVVGTYDGSTAEIYVNGVSENSGSRTLNGYPDDFCIGAAYNNDSSSYFDFFDGVIDDVRVYGGSVLTTGEIWQLYQDGL